MKMVMEYPKYLHSYSHLFLDVSVILWQFPNCHSYWQYKEVATLL